MHGSLFLGFDGGATKTSGAAIDADRNVAAEDAGGPSNFLIIGTDKASANILEVADSIVRKAKTDFSEIAVIYLGLSGAGRVSDADRMRDAFIEFLGKKGYPVPEIGIGSDALATLEGAFPGKPGMILISGTGSILFAKDKHERIHRVGGWGRFIGDEGSGYALGRACLSAVAREMDGRGRKTSMSRLLKEERDIGTSEDLISRVYRENLDIASLAQIVIKAADSGDAVATEIVEAAAEELQDHVRAVLPKLDAPVPVVLSGNVLSTDNSLSRKLKTMLQKNFPNIKIQEPEFPPAVGAAFLALKIERSR